MSAPLYHSPRGLYRFQAEGIAQWLLMKSLLCTWETGCGKSHLPLAGGAMLVEEDMANLIVVVCEQGKVKEFVDDFATFTKLRTVKYMGTAARRERIRKAIEGDPEAQRKLKLDGAPQVIVTTYETSRNDLGSFKKIKTDGRSRNTWVPGSLMTTLEHAAPKGLAFVYDESSRLGGRFQAGHGIKGKGWVPQRGSVVYKAHEHMLKVVRSMTDRVWVAGLTATPVETSPENAFNQFRLIDPKRAGGVAAWEKDYIRYKDPFDRAQYKNISEDDIHREPWVTPFSEKIAPIISHKRKTDPDVRAAFPESIEEPIYVEMTKEHADLYKAVEGLAYDKDLFPDGMTRSQEQVMFGILRQIASHPMSLALSPAAAKEGTLANLIVEHVGMAALEAIKVAKEETLVARLKLLVKGQGAQAVVFTFFGQSTLPILQRRLEAEGFKVAPYHGNMSQAQKDASKDAFRAGDFEILLSSDAGARGLNLPEAQYVFNYEMCLTHAKTTQRINRVSRIGSGHAYVTAFSMIVLDTIEEQVMAMNILRQEWHEAILPDDEEAAAVEEQNDFMTRLDAKQRASLFERKKKLAEAA